MIRATPRFAAALAAILLLCYAGAWGKTRVACIGNSITFGSVLKDPATESYPSRLQTMLGDDYEVGNFGLPGATLLRQGHRPYNESQEYRRALAFTPDIAIIHLGINDTDPRDWPIHGDRFVSDYLTLIDSLRAVNPSMRIIIAQLTPIRTSHFRFRSGTRQWLREIQQIIPRIADISSTELISFDQPLRNRQNLLTDGIHPNAEGAQLLADEAYSAITGNYGGLQLPAIYQSGMIMQRDRYLPITGRSNSNASITLTLDGRTYQTQADNRGRWKITTVPLTATGLPVEMTVSDGKDTIRLTDIQPGELWIASGQSNMAFPLTSDSNAYQTISTASSDPLLRFYNMQPIAQTSATKWPDDVISATDRLEYFQPTHWEEASAATVGQWSAVAYYFGRQLRDSLNVPVGVIQNAIGGSPIESWIDVTTLEDNMPEALNNWLTNDYVQPWCQQRARENCGKSTPTLRHPYEPSYLFSAAIEPLGHIPVRGAIWYQGESNAHNTMLHEQLFPMFADSWRRYFADPAMPIIYAQLSSIDRPSWPTFRDSQRRMAGQITNAYMVVTSDLGDSLDVHPRRKEPIGHRMARQALHNVYGFSLLTPGGPEPLEARRDGNAIIIRFKNGNRLQASDGQPLRTFEVASADGMFVPAKAEITDNNELKIFNMDLTDPRIVRYGWQPFTRANLINADSLPASTFQIAVSDCDMQIEDGIECGVSAPFAGMIDGKVIMAGGCNFPTDPLAPTAQKKFYRGIYAADPAAMQWKRIGSLPQPNAYGASVTIPQGIVMIGGTPDGQPTDRVELLTISEGTVSIQQLPSLPATLDNMAAAAIGRKIYVAGGNFAGLPSRKLLMLDLDNLAKGWKQLREMPGNPRVQPIMASAKDASSTESLYLWGGFAGKHSGRDATLELDGLRYNPRTDKWAAIPGPHDSNNTPLATGGAVAVTLADGRIAAAGGVNKDIFLDALRNQAPDYLTHPIEWYRFNPNIMVFDPATSSWSIAATTPDAARAGAAMTADNDDIILIGGELKPRIRTSLTLKLTIPR